MATTSNKQIFVFADWLGLEKSTPLGILTSQRLRGKEIFFFEYENNWLKSNFAQLLDPNLGLFQGKQYLPDGKTNFGLFLDSSPDRWGRLLMRRREAAIAKKEGRNEQTLLESDYLLGVFDGNRSGGLRFKLDANGDYLNNQKEMASPPWTSLRELENASLQLERDDAINDPQYDRWLSLLVDPGSSLGGARPKASVLDQQGNLYLAKFPSANDTKDVGAWEMVLHELAKQSGIEVPETKLMRLSGKYQTFLSKRFDRTNDGKRIHFASAMTLLGYNDGNDYADGISYLELAGFIMQTSPSATTDLEQLWRRIVFSILVSNTDDHLRNHGFLMTANGWRLSPAYDLNPNEDGNGLKLNITEHNNELDVTLALDVSKYFKLKNEKATKILGEITSIVKGWKTVAKQNGIGNNEIDSMKRAFRAE